VRPLLARARSLWDVWPGSRRRILQAFLRFVILVELAVVGSSLGSKLQYPLPHHGRKILILSEIGCLVAFLGALCIALVNEKLERFRVNARVTAQDVEDYVCLRDHLRRLVLIEAAIIGAAILSSGVLRKAIIAWHPKTHEFPSQYVLVYGACFSLLLALLSVPVYGRLQSAGPGLRDASFPLEAPDSPRWRDGYQDRKLFEELLGLQTGPNSGVLAAAAVLTPLAVSLLSLLL
jgi:hypothetical protein